MKLIVQIPCLNEEATLAETVADIPRHIDGVEQVELLIVDDGSTDRTIEVARRCGVEHIIVHKQNMGLAAAFRTGLEACLALDADIIVNTDGDNQYCGADIPRLIRPILDHYADVVIGDRRPGNDMQFSFLKRKLQSFGSLVVRVASGTKVPDAVSGFRAFNREAAFRLNVLSSFSYTIETLLQARCKQLIVASVPVRVNSKTRDSRLFRSLPHFVAKSAATIVRVYAMYQPLKVFTFLGVLLGTLGLIPIGRFLSLYFSGDGEGHIQSLVLGGVLLLMGFFTLLAGMVADLIAFNRRLMEMTLERTRRLEYQILRHSRPCSEASRRHGLSEDRCETL
jgi:glycosyltransferase involved in cell wall biosynthesis